MSLCEECGFIFNRTFDPGKLDYGGEYDNTQACSPFFDAYLDRLVRDLVETHGVRNSNIVEVGCGKGHFLRKLVAYACSGNRGHGFDPSYVGPSSDLNGRLSFRSCFYDQTCTDLAVDVVVCRHVIEHVPDPLSLLRSIRSAVSSSPRARVFCETPCVEWILAHDVIWDFFYEHCSLFTASSLSIAFEAAGFHVQRVKHTFGGQYLWLEASPLDDPQTVQAARDGEAIWALARRYALSEAEKIREWLAALQILRRRGKVALWGAGAKGVTFANLADPNCELLDCVVDINPNKHRRHIPGTGHPIVAPKLLSERRIRSVILMNPNYREENEQFLREAGIDVHLVDCH